MYRKICIPIRICCEFSHYFQDMAYICCRSSEFSMCACVYVRVSNQKKQKNFMHFSLNSVNVLNNGQWIQTKNKTKIILYSDGESVCVCVCVCESQSQVLWMLKDIYYFGQNRCQTVSVLFAWPFRTLIKYFVWFMKIMFFLLVVIINEMVNGIFDLYKGVLKIFKTKHVDRKQKFLNKLWLKSCLNINNR